MNAIQGNDTASPGPTVTRDYTSRNSETNRKQNQRPEERSSVKPLQPKLKPATFSGKPKREKTTCCLLWDSRTYSSKNWVYGIRFAATQQLIGQRKPQIIKDFQKLKTSKCPKSSKTSKILLSQQRRGEFLLGLSWGGSDFSSDCRCKAGLGESRTLISAQDGFAGFLSLVFVYVFFSAVLL